MRVRLRGPWIRRRVWISDAMVGVLAERRIVIYAFPTSNFIPNIVS